MLKDLHHDIGVTLLMEPVDAVHTDRYSDIIDVQGNGFKSVDILAIIAALTGVDGSNYLTPILQESDTTATGDFTSVAAADMLGGLFTKIDSTSADRRQRRGYIGAKRYIRLKFDYTGTGISAGIVGAVAILGHPEVRPVASDPAITATT